jgi:hypothetical protein
VRKQVRQRVAQLAVKAVREESVKRWRREQWINDPWLEGELGPVTTQESRAAMMGGELDKKGRAGWEEGKKYQGADQKRDIQAEHKWLDPMSNLKHGKECAWRQKGGKIATEPGDDKNMERRFHDARQRKQGA